MSRPTGPGRVERLTQPPRLLLYNFDIEFFIEFPYTTQCKSLGHYFDEDKNSRQNGRLKLIVKDKTYETNNATFYLQKPRDGIVHGKAKVNVDGLTVS